MNELEDIVLQEFEGFKRFFTDFLDLDDKQKHALDNNMPKIVVSHKLEHYAALEFSSYHFQLSYQPEAVQNPLATTEEPAHYFNMVLSPEHRTRLLQAEKGSELYLKLEYRAEYIARLMALIYLGDKGIKEYNQVWSNIEKNKIILTTEPLSAKAHYLGYTKAEKDFATMTPQQLKEKLKKVLFGNDISEFSDIYKLQMPRIIAIPQQYQLAA